MYKQIYDKEQHTHVIHKWYWEHICVLQSDGDQIYFETLAQSFHNGQVLGLDVCIRKPLIATCSSDKSVRIWNYETW